MIQLLAHLWGDFALQPGKWAMKKRSDIRYALVHSLEYGLVFWLICTLMGQPLSWDAMLAIVVTHALIDRFYPARYIIFAKNWIADRKLMWKACSKTGFDQETPIWLSMWLLIVVDNTMHLTINYAAIKWLV